MVTVECIVSKKIEGQTNKQTNKQTREPLSKGESRTGLIAFHIQLPLSNFDRSSVPNLLLFFQGYMIFNLGINGRIFVTMVTVFKDSFHSFLL